VFGRQAHLKVAPYEFMIKCPDDEVEAIVDEESWLEVAIDDGVVGGGELF
jgi:hypothetical protein